MSKVRILQLRPFKSDGWKSIERYGRLITSLNSKNPNVEVVAYTPPEHWKLFGNIVARRVFYCLKCMFFRDFDIVHILDAAYSNLLWFLPRGKTVVTCHDTEIWRTTNFWNKPFRSLLLRSLATAGTVVTPSNVVADQLKKLFSANGLRSPRIKVIANGVDPIFQPRLAQSKNQSPRILLYIAQAAWPRKNFGFLASVLNSLKKLNPDFKLVHLGSPLEREQLRILHENGVNKHWQTVSNLTDQQVVDLYQEADLVLIPSLYEGFGYPLIESSACMKPFLASDIPTFRELLPGANMLLPFDADVWAEAIQSYFEDAFFKEQLENQSSDLKSKYNLNSHLNEYEHLYGSIKEIANRI